MQILHLDSSPLGEHSASRQLSRQVVEKLQAAHPDATVVYRDLSAEPLPFVTAAWVEGAFTPPESHSEAAKSAIALSNKLVDELLASDIIVAGAPMYNFSIPAAFKAWIDQIVRVGRTFSPSYEGLATGKKAIFAIAAGGGGYGEGEPRQAYNHEDRYLRDIFAFIGISDVQFAHFYNTVGERRPRGEQTAQQEVQSIAA